MGLYDVIGDIANAQNQKTATGDNRIWGVVVGVVTKNYAESMEGRVCVQIPTRGQDKDDNILKWARVAMNSFGKGWGTYFLPEVGDEVLLVFENGDIEKPYVIGCIPMNNSSCLKNADEYNTIKTITTKHGSNVTFFDSNEDEDGKKDKITVQTATKDQYQMIEMDNDKETIKITNKEKDNSIVMETNHDKGVITIKASQKLVIDVGDGMVKIIADNMGKLSVQAKQISLESTEGKISLNSKTQLELAGSAATNVSGGNVKVDSQGMINLSGQAIMMK